MFFILNSHYSNTLARAAGAPLACMQLVNNVGDAVQNGVFRKHSERIVPAHVLLELGLLEEVPGGDARSPHHRGVDVVVECLGGGEGEGVKGGWGSGWSRGCRGARVGTSVMGGVGGNSEKIILWTYSPLITVLVGFTASSFFWTAQ